ESNLTQNIYTLRRILGNGDGNGLFIETVPRRGYRFVATVHERVAKATDVIDPASASDTAPAPSPDEDGEGGGPHAPMAAGSHGWAWMALLLTVAGVALAIIATRSGRFVPMTNATTPAIERLTSDGSVRIAALSPDSRDMAYVRSEGVRQSLW